MDHSMSPGNFNFLLLPCRTTTSAPFRYPDVDNIIVVIGDIVVADDVVNLVFNPIYHWLYENLFTIRGGHMAPLLFLSK